MVTMKQTSCHGLLVVWLCLFIVVCQSDEAVAMEKRIVNGRYAKPHAYPWMLSLQTDSRHHCGAVLVATDIAITAAHCLKYIQGSPSLTIVCGAHDISDTTESSRQVIPVKNWTMHANFSHSTTGPRALNDIAVLHLSSNATINNYCKEASFCRKDFTNKMAILSGWGLSWRYNATVNSGLSDMLKECRLRILTDQACRQQVWWDGGNKTADYANLCADSKTCGGCNKDSGGALQVKKGRRTVVVGLVSWGDFQCRLLYPGVFVRLSTYISWVHQTMAQMRST